MITSPKTKEKMAELQKQEKWQNFKQLFSCDLFTRKSRLRISFSLEIATKMYGCPAFHPKFIQLTFLPLNDVLDEYHFQMTTSYPNLSPFMITSLRKTKEMVKLQKQKKWRNFKLLFLCDLFTRKASQSTMQTYQPWNNIFLS